MIQLKEKKSKWIAWKSYKMLTALKCNVFSADTFSNPKRIATSIMKKSHKEKNSWRFQIHLQTERNSDSADEEMTEPI